MTLLLTWQQRLNCYGCFVYWGPYRQHSSVCCVFVAKMAYEERKKLHCKCRSYTYYHCAWHVFFSFFTFTMAFIIGHKALHTEQVIILLFIGTVEFSYNEVASDLKIFLLYPIFVISIYLLHAVICDKYISVTY